MLGQRNVAPVEQQEASLNENLLALAELEFRIALETCGDCRNYHALFGYGRLAGANSGIETDGDIIAPILAGLSRPAARVLIAGAADAGLLALTARAMRSCLPLITVADRCATPLAVCRQFAASHGLKIATVQVDLVAMQPSERFDVILAHKILNHIPAIQRAGFFDGLRRSLAKGGTLVLVNRSRKPVAAGGKDAKRGEFGKMMAALAVKGIPFPEDVLVFRKRLEDLDEAQYTRDVEKLDLAEIESHLAASGFQIRERIDHDGKAGSGKAGGTGNRAVTHFHAAVLRE